jgi:hypothetical protein
MQVATEEDAVQVLIADQVSSGGIATQPAGADTIVTESGWAFFNVNGYLGTVTEDGDVILEEQFEDD